MKSKFLLFFAIAAFLASHAQLVIKDTGKATLGLDLGLDEQVIESQRDTITMLKIYGNGYYASRARMSFGDAASTHAMNVMIGEFGNDDTDKLWIHGKKGLYYTANSRAQDTIFFFDREGDAMFHFNCDVKSTGVFIASDNRFKENVEPLGNVLDQVSRLEPVSYDLKGKMTDGAAAKDVTGDGHLVAKDAEDVLIDRHVKEQHEQYAQRFGFIAQQLQEIFPELVREDENGMLYVDYIGLVPILVQSINELRAEIKTLKEDSTADISGDVMKSPRKVDEEQLPLGLLTPSLKQNKPNPFNSVTTIEYSLPETVARADIYIYDLQGHQVMSVPAEGRGAASVEINGGRLSAGMYIYTLIADGMEIDSRRMIITN